jgi:sugar phosphate isomerase/epimerase
MCLSLGWLTVRGAHPIEHIDAAIAGRFNAVGLRLVPPTPGDPLVPVVGDESLIREIETRLRAEGISVLDVETVWIGPDIDVAALLPAMEVAQRLGSRNLLTMGNDQNLERLTENFSRLCDQGARFGLNVGMEFAAYTSVPTVQAAQALVRRAGRSNGCVLVDALHFARSGGTPEQLESLDAHLLAYCQLADARGPRPAGNDALKVEARGGRYLPGEGELPLAQLLDAMPQGLPLCVEAPCAATADLPVVDRGRIAGAATWRFLETYRHRTLP